MHKVLEDQVKRAAEAVFSVARRLRRWNGPPEMWEDVMTIADALEKIRKEVCDDNIQIP